MVNGDYLSSDMCFALLGYMAERVMEESMTLLTAMPSLPLAIVNQTQVQHGHFTVHSARASPVRDQHPLYTI